jgi:hypothetical protein
VDIARVVVKMATTRITTTMRTKQTESSGERMASRMDIITINNNLRLIYLIIIYNKEYHQRQ